MNKLTSMADLHYRIKQDERYKQVVVLAFKESGCAHADKSFEAAMIWIDRWLQNHQNTYRGENFTCVNMMEYLNRMMDRIPIFSSKLMSPHTINTFTNQKID